MENIDKDVDSLFRQIVDIFVDESESVANRAEKIKSLIQKFKDSLFLNKPNDTYDYQKTLLEKYLRDKPTVIWETYRTTNTSGK